MTAEQTISSEIWLSDHHPSIDIRLTARVEIPAGETDVDVATDLIFEPKLPEHLRETVHSYIYNGVHDGIASTGFSLPSDGIKIIVSRLDIFPASTTITREPDIQRLGISVHDLIMSLIADLWTKIR